MTPWRNSHLAVVSPVISSMDLKEPRISFASLRSKYHVVPAKEVTVVPELANSRTCAFPMRHAWLISFLSIRWPKKVCRFKE